MFRIKLLSKTSCFRCSVSLIATMLLTAGCNSSTAVGGSTSAPTQQLTLSSGSINASMTENRELGMYIRDATAVQLLDTTIINDYNGGTAY